MGKKVRVFLMRIIAILIVVVMVGSLGSSLFYNKKDNAKEEQTEEKTASKYTFVNDNAKFHLDAINQDLLLPKGCSLQEKLKNEETGALSYNYGQFDIDGHTFALLISTMESNNGGKFDDMQLYEMDVLADGLKEAEYENTNQLLFQGEQKDYMETVKTIFDAGKEIPYQIDYSIYDLEGKNYYTISVFLLSPENPSKTDRLALDALGKEVMSLTKYSNYEVSKTYTLPEGKEDLYN